MHLGQTDGRTDGQTDRQTDRLFASAWCKNEKIQIHGPTILVIITFSSTECLSKSAQMSRLARA